MSWQEILNAIDKWVSEGSGWVIDRIDSHYINVTLYKPLNGSSYIELPTELGNSKKGLINMKNKDEECFRWCHIRHLNPQTKYPERIKKEDKKMINELNYDEIDFPLSQKHYNKVEKQNSIRINVFGYEHGQPFPIHISKETFKDQMNLLLITEDEKKHYVLIKDFNAFMYNQTKHKNKKYFCMYCLQCFSSEKILANHVINCLEINGAQAINMPKQGENILKFNNFQNQLPVPFVIYADFEAITKKVQGCEGSEEMKKDKDRRSYTEAYETHEDCGYGYKVVCCYDDKYSKYTRIYRGENAVYKFMEKMLEEVKHCKAVIKKHFNKPLVMTEVDEQHFKTMDGCHICGEKYTDKDVRVRDHCHITGKFRGSAHQECDLKLRIKPEHLKIPVILKSRISNLVHNAFRKKDGSVRYTNIKLTRAKGYFTHDINGGGDNMFTADSICEMIEFLIDNIFVQFGGRLFRQVIGIPMGTNCAPLLADLFLYSYENEFLDNMIRSGHRRLARSFNLCYRYIDDLIVFNNKKFLDYLKEIYPSQLTVEKANKSDHLADYLDLTFIIDSGGKLSTRLYDKRDDFDFHIVNFPFLSSNIPSGPSYGVYISQLIRYA